MAIVNVREAYRIISLTKASEYLALSAENKAWYDLFISAGLVDLTEGSLAQEKLWDMFDAESNTGSDFRDVNNGLVVPPAIEE